MAAAAKPAPALPSTAVMALESIGLLGAEIGVEAARLLGPVLANCSTLASLSLSGNTGLGAVGGAALADAVRGHTALTLLDAGGCGLRAAGCVALLSTAVETPCLGTLALYSNGVGDDGGEPIGAALATLPPGGVALTALDLSNNGLGELGVAELLQGLQYCECLTVLQLGRVADPVQKAFIERRLELNLQHALGFSPPPRPRSEFDVLLSEAKAARDVA
eukprot:SAG11_NODE_11584_length_751_cov_0.621166_1_plen_219_part_10